MIRNKKYNSFTGKAMYDVLVPENHFLRKVNSLTDWVSLARMTSPCYKGGFQLGASPVSPVTLIKMILVSYLYNLSERQTEVMCNDSIPFKYFIEIAVDEKAPDHSTLSKFRTRIIDHYSDERIFEKMFEDVLRGIMDTDIRLGNVQVIDSKHMNARVSAYRKTKGSDDEGKGSGKNGRPEKRRRIKREIDPEASTGVKGTERKKDKNGRTVEMLKTFFGYKAHCSIENENDIITSCILSTGSRPDGEYLGNLLWKDIAIRGKPDICSADRGYDWGENHFLLNQLDMGDAIILKETRLKDEARYAVWHKIADSDEYKNGKKERFKIERTFGQCVNSGGMHHCRYFGKVRTAFQMYFTAMAYNIKKAVKALHGLSPKQPVPVCAF